RGRKDHRAMQAADSTWVGGVDGTRAAAPAWQPVFQVSQPIELTEHLLLRRSVGGKLPLTAKVIWEAVRALPARRTGTLTPRVENARRRRASIIRSDVTRRRAIAWSVHDRGTARYRWHGRGLSGARCAFES